MARHFVSIWFFIGILLDIYGILILGAGIYDLVQPPEHPVKMAYLTPESGGALCCCCWG